MPDRSLSPIFKRNKIQLEQVHIGEQQEMLKELKGDLATVSVCQL